MLAFPVTLCYWSWYLQKMGIFVVVICCSVHLTKQQQIVVHERELIYFICFDNLKIFIENNIFKLSLKVR